MITLHLEQAWLLQTTSLQQGQINIIECWIVPITTIVYNLLFIIRIQCFETT